MATIVTEASNGRRTYVKSAHFGDPAIERIKAAIGWQNLHYDREAGTGMFWFSPKFKGQVEAILKDGGAVNLRDNVERAQRADQLEDEGRQEEADKLRKGPPQEDPRKVRVVAKCRYKGKAYYASFVGETKRGYAAHLHSLPNDKGDYISFWKDVDRSGCDAEKATVERTYEPREVWDGRRYSGKTVKEYQTLQGMADFIKGQKGGRTARGRCTECDAWGPVGEPCRECGGEGTHV